MKKLILPATILLLAVSLSINFLAFRTGDEPVAAENLGQVTEMNGLKIFMMTEPTQPYEQLSQIEPHPLSIQKTPYEWASKFVEMAMERRGDGLPVEGIIYKSGRSAILIRFKGKEETEEK